MVVNAVVIMMIYGEVVRVDGEEDESVFYTKPAGMYGCRTTQPCIMMSHAEVKKKK